MGNICTCFRSKDKESDLTILNDSQSFHFCKYHKLILQSISFLHIKICVFITVNNLESIIKIQSHLRGLFLRKKITKHLFSSNQLIPYLEQDIPYTTAKHSLITQEEIDYLFNNYPPLNDGIDVILISTIEYSNGCQYYGEWNKINNQRHGRGILKWPEGFVYFGQFKMDSINGKGKLITNNGEYEGDWADNKANGLGTYRSKEVKYEGKWKDDRQDGIGTEIWADGTNYTGEFKEGHKHGQGKFKYSDGSNYFGGFLNNQLHGKGRYVWADGREYDGDWKYNKIDGEGVFKWPDGRKYTGHYKHDKKNGYGIFEWPDGKKYKGNWENGKQNGQGEYYNPKEQIWVKGFWKNGKKEKNPKIDLFTPNKS